MPRIHFTIWDWLGIILCSIPAFYLLGSPAIYIWDEAVYANASWEIANGASWITPVQENYNTKPPLVLWLQAISLNIFPSPEFAVRFPSALAVTGILIMMTMGLKRWDFPPWSRLLVMVCFIGHEGFIRHHIARTGDLDAVMTLFVTGYVLVVLDALYFNRWSNKHLLFFFIMIVAAFYSKSVGGWLMLGPLSIVWLLSPLRNVFMRLRFWVFALLSLGICLLYYFMRESNQPGYLALTWNSEYMRMFENIMPWHEQPFNFYFKNFIRLKTFTPWIFLLLSAIFYCLLFIREKEIKQQAMRWIILSLGYLLVISIPAVKLEWYDAPVFPFFAMIMGVSLVCITEKLPGHWKFLWLIPMSFVFWRKLDFIQQDIHTRHPFEKEGSMLRKAQVNADTKIFMPVQTPEHRLQLDFYRKMKSKDGVLPEVYDTISQVLPGQQIIISSENGPIITREFDVDTVNTWRDLGVELKINQRIQQ